MKSTRGSLTLGHVSIHAHTNEQSTPKYSQAHACTRACVVTRAHVLAHCLLRAAACSRTNTAPWTGTHPHSCTCTRLRAHSHQWADRAVPVRCEGAPQLTSSGANRPRASARSDYWRCSSCSRSLTPWGSRSRPGSARAGTFGGSTDRPRLRGPGAFSRRRDLTGNNIRWPKLVEDLHEHGDGSDTM